MSKLRNKFFSLFWYTLKDNRGGTHVLVFVLFSAILIALIWAVSINWILQVSSSHKLKPALDQATKAAAADVNEIEKARGRLVWDSGAGTKNFYKYLRLNLRLDNDDQPQNDSFLTSKPIVHVLEAVTANSYPFFYQKSISVNSGTDHEVTRNIAVTIYGPSVVAIVEIKQPLLGFSRSEPIVKSSVSNIRFR
ncbi:hypothetical protein [Cohnella phaseoli]|uniref:Flp pilus-assembly TadE/G-like protein n=1 Tax=Cohnella phaseoli TaxID=456490 RepID=A0A3D9JPP1_9BACL|nr:hypothetical protein [Cohnella phaseoli]RED75978.1 hypothetical protein DFP98_11338 [Cohnella phaseoli]